MTKKKTASTAAKKPTEKKPAAKKTAKKVEEKVLENEDKSLEIKESEVGSTKLGEGEKSDVGSPMSDVSETGDGKTEKGADTKESGIEEKTGQEAGGGTPEPEKNGIEDLENNQESQSFMERMTKLNGPVVVIPFKATMAKANELQFAVRAWEKNFPNVIIVVIGDSLPWFGKEIIHIEHKTTSDNPQIDVAQKMMAAIASEEVPDWFIWSNDDIYPVSNLTISDIDVLKANGRLGRKGTPGSVYSKNADRTLAALKKLKIDDPWDFATHTPVVLWKKELAEVIQQFNCDKEGHLVYTLYANTLYQGFNPIIVDNGSRGSIVACVYRPNPNKEVLDKAFAERKFINHNDAGWPAVAPYLKERFGEKSRFEK